MLDVLEGLSEFELHVLFAGINSIFELNASINLFPNPTRSELNIQIINALVGNEMCIFDAVGKLVFKQQLLSTQTTVSVSNFADGNYIVRVGEMNKIITI